MLRSFALAAFLTACGGSFETRVAPVVEPEVEVEVVPSCTTTARELLATLGDGAPTPRPGDEPRLLMWEHTGACPLAVLVVRVAGDTFDDHPYGDEADGATDRLHVFRFSGGRWSPIGHMTFDATRDQGTFDYAPGVGEVRVDTLGPLSLLVVNTEQAQGSVDPRWTRARTHYFSVANGELIEAFACATTESLVSGPCRTGTNTVRSLALRATPTPTIVVTRRDSTDINTDEECDIDIRSEPPQTAEYRLRSNRFLPVGEDVCD